MLSSDVAVDNFALVEQLRRTAPDVFRHLSLGERVVVFQSRE
jgi:hypothetical protein